MTRFAIGDVVIKDKRTSVIIRAIFTTVEGQLRYAVENEGALEFIDEARLSQGPKGDLAA